MTETFEANLARMFAVRTTPRLSGVQVKAPMNLGPIGELRPAADLAFTHILKPAGTSGFEQMPVVEWLCLELGRSAGFATAATALVPMPDGMPPALLVERFDIRETADDDRRIALEDFCSVLGVPSADKYKGTIERTARAIRGISTEPDADVAILFERALFAWLIADDDMHLKNLAMLKTARPGARRFASVRMAPLYDALTTRVFPGLAHDRMALTLAGKDDRLRWTDFQTLARTIDLTLERAGALAKRMATALPATLDQVRLPAPAAGSSSAVSAAKAVTTIVRSRCAALVSEL